MQNTINYIARLILDNYAGIIIGMITTPFLLYLWKWMQNKTDEVKHLRIRFFIGSVILGAIAMIALIGTVGALKQKDIKPNLRCDIDGVIFGKTLEGKTTLAFLVKIINSGAPTVAWKWRAKVSFVSGQTFEANADLLPLTLVNLKTATHPEITLAPEKYLPITLLESPLLNGAGRAGWVMFTFDRISFDDLNRIGNKLVLKFEDSTGRITIAEHAVDTSAF